MIPDDAVEAAARVHQDLLSTRGHPGWDELLSGFGHEWRLEFMRAALVAAAPHLMEPVVQLADELEASNLSGDNYMSGRGSGFRMAGVRIRQALGLYK